MDKVKLVLTLISVAITVGPIAAGLLMYRDNLLNLVLPSNLQDTVHSFTSDKPEVKITGNPTINRTERTVSFQYEITNPYGFDMVLNELTSNVVCANHTGVMFGHATVLGAPITIQAKSTRELSILMTYTKEGESHVKDLELHPPQSKIYVYLTDLKVNIQGITISLEEPKPMEIPRP
jgi:hypothetical protein